MNQRARPTGYCGQCGSAVQEEDKFCGTCGAVVLPPPPQAEQAISREVAASHGHAARGRRRRFSSAVGLAAFAAVLLLLGGGALAAVTLGDGLRLGGGANPPPAASTTPEGTPADGDTTERRSPAPPEATSGVTEDPEGAATVSPDSPPDPAFDRILPTLREATSAPIMLPAELPDELRNVAVDADASGDGYGVLFLAEPTGNVLEHYVRANDAGTLTASPEQEEKASEYFEATGVETVKLPDGTEATLRYMEPVTEGGNYGPHWEGEFERYGNTHTLTVPS